MNAEKLNKEAMIKRILAKSQMTADCCGTTKCKGGNGGGHRAVTGK